MSICSVDGCCDEVYAKGFCSKHYQRYRKYGTTDSYIRAPGEVRACSVHGCENSYSSKGYCDKHYRRLLKYGSPEGGAANHAPIEERFWRYVEKTDGCWNWLAVKNKQGYGLIGLGGAGTSKKLAHRLSYEMHQGPIPENMVLMHICDNPACVRPDHLRPGTQKENIRDAMMKGRASKPPLIHGEKHPKAKLTKDDVAYIRTCGKPTKELAEAYGVSISAIVKARNGETWSRY